MTELQSHIVKKFPLLYRNCIDGHRLCNYHCEDGWNGLLEEAGTRINEIAERHNLTSSQYPVVDCIKEKFGKLRIYISPLDASIGEEVMQEIFAVLEDIEHKSSTVCEFCGKAGQVTTNKKGTWMKAVCESELW